jgi:hypothetical protein
MLNMGGCKTYLLPKLEDQAPSNVRVGINEQILESESTDTTRFVVICAHGMGTHRASYAETFVVDSLVPGLHLQLQEPVHPIPIQFAVPGAYQGRMRA